jgi:hypothetical protein
VSSYFISPEEENHIPTQQEIEVEAEKFIEQHKIRDMFNDIVILADTRLVRLIGFAYDSCDFYYICRDYEGKLIRMTAVAAIFSLKGIYDRYEHMECVFHINRCPRSSLFLIEHYGD